MCRLNFLPPHDGNRIAPADRQMRARMAIMLSLGLCVRERLRRLRHEVGARLGEVVVRVGESAGLDGTGRNPVRHVFLIPAHGIVVLTIETR